MREDNPGADTGGEVTVGGTGVDVEDEVAVGEPGHIARVMREARTLRVITQQLMITAKTHSRQLV